MKKLLLTAVALAALTLMAAPHSSYAQAPSGEEGYIGLYFDNGGATEPGLSCTTADFLAHVTAYIVYLDPNLTSTRGFECGIDITSPTATTFNSSVGMTYPTDTVDVGQNDAGAGTYNYIAGYAAPVNITGSSFILGTLDIFYLDMATELDFTLRGAIPSSDLVNGRSVIMRDDFSLGFLTLTQAEGSPTMILNATSGDCSGVTLPTEDMSFGAVKGLFR